MRAPRRPLGGGNRGQERVLDRAGSVSVYEPGVHPGGGLCSVGRWALTRTLYPGWGPWPWERSVRLKRRPQRVKEENDLGFSDPRENLLGAGLLAWYSGPAVGVERGWGDGFT